jgi:hypothetical protein
MTPPIRVLLIENNPGDADLIRDTLDTSQCILEGRLVSCVAGVGRGLGQ